MWGLPVVSVLPGPHERTGSSEKIAWNPAGIWNDENKTLSDCDETFEQDRCGRSRKRWRGAKKQQTRYVVLSPPCGHNNRLPLFSGLYKTIGQTWHRKMRRKVSTKNLDGHAWKFTKLGGWPKVKVVNEDNYCYFRRFLHNLCHWALYECVDFVSLLARSNKTR